MTSDLAYANAAFIPGADAFPPRWAAEAEAFRAAQDARGQLGLAYGAGPRQKLDLFRPDGEAVGLMVFVHGGYWLAFGREGWSHLAAGALARGWAVALPSYTLAPEARISAMTVEVGQAIAMAAARVDGPIVVTGHSAGGHLSARMACADAPLAPDVASRIVRAIPISPLAELAPLMATAMNEKLCIDAAEAERESPARLTLRPGCDVTVWVGGQERPSFLWQARTLSEAWSCPWHVEPGRHHFDVIDDLVDPESLLVRTLTEA
jgi:acetyl esterase/lipase